MVRLSTPRYNQSEAFILTQVFGVPLAPEQVEQEFTPPVEFLPLRERSVGIAQLENSHRIACKGFEDIYKRLDAYGGGIAPNIGKGWAIRWAQRAGCEFSQEFMLGRKISPYTARKMLKQKDVKRDPSLIRKLTAITRKRRTYTLAEVEKMLAEEEHALQKANTPVKMQAAVFKLCTKCTNIQTKDPTGLCALCKGKVKKHVDDTLEVLESGEDKMSREQREAETAKLKKAMLTKGGKVREEFLAQPGQTLKQYQEGFERMLKTYGVGAYAQAHEEDDVVVYEGSGPTFRQVAGPRTKATDAYVEYRRRQKR